MFEGKGSDIILIEIKKLLDSPLPLSGFLCFMENITCKCGSSDYRIEPRGIHQTAYCNICDSYIKNLPQGKPALLYFGKYKGRELASMIEAEEVVYLKWLVTKPDLKPNSLRLSIEEHLSSK